MELKLLKKPVFWLILLAALVWAAVWQLPDNRLRLIFCNVGQGDAILITYQDQQILIDGGPNNEVLTCLAEHLPFWDRTIEMLIATHPDADHLTGLVAVVERYNVDQFVVNAVAKDSAVFREFHQAVLAEATSIHSPQAGDKLRLGPVQLVVLWPTEKLGDGRLWETSASRLALNEVLGAATYGGDSNETSIVLKLSYGQFDALLAGDIGFETEEKISPSEVEVLKVAHHGSKYATSEEFLQQVSPELAVISVGKNSFGHPAPELLERFRLERLDVQRLDLSRGGRRGAKVLRTDQVGEIEIITDGESWQLVLQ